MTELGNRLKEARNEKGLSLDDLQSITKIQKRYLIGIEEGNYSSMPGNFYVRAFIKQYAEALGLNPEELFEVYKSEIPATHKDDIPQQLSRVKTHKSITGGSSKVFDILPKILIGVFILGVAGIVYVFLYKHGATDSNESVNKEKNAPTTLVKSQDLESNKETDNNQNDTTTEQKGETAQSDDTSTQTEETPAVETPQQELKVVKSSGRDSTYSLNAADKFVVKLVSKGKTWVSIKNGKGRSFFQGTLATGAVESHTEDLTAESDAVIRVGNAAETEIYVNDQKLEYASTAKDVQNITIQYVPKNE